MRERDFYVKNRPVANPKKEKIRLVRAQIITTDILGMRLTWAGLKLYAETLCVRSICFLAIFCDFLWRPLNLLPRCDRTLNWPAPFVNCHMM